MRRSACSRRKQPCVLYERPGGIAAHGTAAPAGWGVSPPRAVRGRPIAGVAVLACWLATLAGRCRRHRCAKRGQAVSGRGWEARGEVPEGGHFFALYTPALGVCRDGRRDLPRVAEGKEVGAAGVPQGGRCNWCGSRSSRGPPRSFTATFPPRAPASATRFRRLARSSASIGSTFRGRTGNWCLHNMHSPTSTSGMIKCSLAVRGRACGPERREGARPHKAHRNVDRLSCLLEGPVGGLEGLEPLSNRDFPGPGP